MVEGPPAGPYGGAQPACRPPIGHGAAGVLVACVSLGARASSVRIKLDGALRSATLAARLRTTAPRPVVPSVGSLLTRRRHPSGDPGAVSREGPRTAQLAKGRGPLDPRDGALPALPTVSRPAPAPPTGDPAEAAHEDGEALHGTACRQCARVLWRRTYRGGTSRKERAVCEERDLTGAAG